MKLSWARLFRGAPDRLRPARPQSTAAFRPLSRAVSILRARLGDDPKDPRYIQTIPKVGYRLLMPVESAADEPAQEQAGAAKSGDYLYEPSAEAVLAALLPKSVRNRVFNAIAEAATSEHGARMTSMGAATDNAGKMIDSLTLFRNRARQAAITQEISEIVGGANALA